MSANCKTCKHNDGRMVVSKGEEPCYSCLSSGKEFPKYEADIQRITNADKIRAMSDEELAAWLAYNAYKHFDDFVDLMREKENIIVHYETLLSQKRDFDLLEKNALDWLRSPAEETA